MCDRHLNKLLSSIKNVKCCFLKRHYNYKKRGVLLANSLEIRERQKSLLFILLEIKRANEGREINLLGEKIKAATVVMDQEDIAHVEKISGIKALD